MEREESCLTELFCDEPALDNREPLFLNKGLDHILVDLAEDGFDSELAVFSVCLDEPELDERENGFQDFDDESELGLRKDFTDCLEDPKLEERENGFKADGLGCFCTRSYSFFCFRPHFVFPRSVDRTFAGFLGFLIAALLL